MAINIATDIVVTTGGKLSSITQIQGGWQSVDTYSTMAALTGSSTLKGKLSNGQLFYVVDEDQLYKCTVAGAGPLASYSFSSFAFEDTTNLSALNTFTGSAQTSLDALNAASSSYALKTDVSGAFTSVSSSVSTRLATLEAGGGSVPAGTISSSTQISDFGFISSSQAIASDISGAFTSLSSSISTRLTSVEGASGGDVTALNLFTGSAQTSLDALNAATASYALKTDVSGAFTSVSGGLESRITTLEGASGGDVTALNLFTGSIQTQVDSLTSATSSYVTNSETSSFAIKTDISGAFVAPSASISTRLTSLEVGGGSVPAGTISSSTQISDFGFISSSQAIATDISGAFTAVSGGLAGRITTLEATSGGDVTALNLFTSSIQTQVDNLTAETSSYLTSADTASFIVVSQTSSMSVATASYIDPTFISASAAAAGFGSGGSTIPAGTVSSSAQVVQNLVGQDVVVSSITAETYIVSSSVSYITTSFSSGSTKFGDDLNDTHIFTGSLLLTGSITANTFIGNLNYDYLTNLPNLISSSAQIALLGAGIVSSSAQIANEISGAFTSLSSSLASRITALEVGSGGGSGIFALTGSFYSTTNNLQITGSLSVGSGSFKAFEVDADGFVVLGDMDKDLNNAPAGTIVYSGSGFYLIS